MKIKRKFLKKKDTKNTTQYKEVDEGEGEAIGTLYIQKTESENLGDEITVTVESS